MAVEIVDPTIASHNHADAVADDHASNEESGDDESHEDNSEPEEGNGLPKDHKVIV